MKIIMAMSDLRPVVIEVDKTQFTPEKPTRDVRALRDRLQNSPRKETTPDQIRTKQVKAEQRRLIFEHEKVEKAHADVEHVQQVREKVKANKENESSGTEQVTAQDI